MMRSSALAAVLAAAAAGGFGQSALGATEVRPAFHGREVYKIVNVQPSSKRPTVTASGAFKATGTFDREDATLAFPKGRIIVFRHATHTEVFPPDLATCRFEIRQWGTFLVTKATGRYRGLRESGRFSTTIRGRLNRTGPDRCGHKLVAYRAVSYEVGTVH